jgi:uncharacterized membrane protein
MFRRYFITGLLLWIPVAITLWVLDAIVTTMDLSLSLLPVSWQPQALLGWSLPGIGVVFTVSVVFLTGVLARNFLGERLVAIWEAMLARIPIVSTIYSSVKQVSDTLLSPQGNAFRKALLVEYPRRGAWTIAFLTGAPADEVRRRMDAAAAGGMAGSVAGLAGASGSAGTEMVSVYVPTTPNPTSGFFLMMRRDETIELDMSVDQTLKYIVSMGVVAPIDSKRLPVRPPSRDLKAEIN